ncbi:PhzF family phenazine biosynthesis protein [Chondrinema litorale]|uniref:PhzF family phenazine biosynthesis protein n=1 Tax=Chondrinema litorale TaxID=2994555 RepID=UPI002542F9EC|nr:PhzF family phenazine biosynthesis protein [Chondrinema litorale]UZR99336.1 PhzF family phenazine biosynthesis protein [Chondrinema litorale]
MQADYFLLDVFTNKKFGGNQLAVFAEANEIPENKLQLIAKELNLPESVFLYPPETETGDYKMRIFTPGKELPTAGHPTIGTSHLLLNELKKTCKEGNVLKLEQLVGEIPVTFDKEAGKCVHITMKQPNPEFGRLIQKRELVAEILSIDLSDLMPGKPIQCISCGNPFVFVPVKSLAVLANIKPRVDLLQQYENTLGTSAFYVFTNETQSEADTRGRMFAPLWGITEDPATGSASGPLGCYLVRHGLCNGENILCEQGFEMGRPSSIRVSISHTNHIIDQVFVGGEAVLVGKGTLFI